MRGAPQSKDISNVTVDKTLEGITSIGTITFTGGEPTLAVDRIRYVYEQIKKRGIEIQSFYVATNGKVASKELVHVLLDLYALIDYPEEGLNTLTISKDQYHEEMILDTRKADRLYSGLKFYEPNRLNREIEMPISEGRAKRNKLGKRDVYIEPLAIEIDDHDQPERVEGTVYVNVHGDVIPSCDMSFDSQENNKIGNVHKNTLPEILIAEVSKGVS
jgi:organic radical activating enzyme